MQNDRLNKLDAWRAICCLGVLWIHCWHLNNSIPLNLFGVNLFKLLSIFGNGVDFFFVISGFCMYYFYIGKLENINFKAYKNFIISRIYRIYPAFTISLVVYLIYLKTGNNFLQNLELFFLNILQLQNISNVYEISSHLWSISVEWQFYLLFPFILYFNFKTNSFAKYIIILTVILSSFGVYTIIINEQFDYFILARFSEFAAGLLVGYYYKHKYSFTHNRVYSYILAIFFLFFGRGIITDQVLHSLNSRVIYALLKVFGYAFMTSGFAYLLLLSLSSNNIKNTILDFKPLVFIGKISYSFYLWHGIVVSIVWICFSNFGVMKNISLEINLILQFLLSVLLTTPIAYLSYLLFERNIKYKWKN